MVQVGVMSSKSTVWEISGWCRCRPDWVQGRGGLSAVRHVRQPLSPHTPFHTHTHTHTQWSRGGVLEELAKPSGVGATPSEFPRAWQITKTGSNNKTAAFFLSCTADHLSSYLIQAPFRRNCTEGSVGDVSDAQWYCLQKKKKVD